MTQGLPVSRLVNVGVTLSPSPPTSPSVNSTLVLGSSDVIDVTQRMRTYSSISAIATDFGTTAPEYLAAVLWFEQNPQPTSLFIGRWAQTATHGRLMGAPLTAAQQALANWTAVTNGSFKITVDSGTAQNVTGLNFSADTNLNGVASTINAVLTGATITWNATYGQFFIKSNSTGATSAVSFLSSEGAGTDISGMLGMTSASSGACVVAGMAAETAVSAVTLFDAQFADQWYALTICGAQDSDHQAVAAYIEASSNKHYYGITTQEAGVLVSTDTADIAYLIQQAGYNRTCVQYSSQNPYAVVSYLARILTTNWTANNTTITLMYKQEPGIVAENLNSTQVAAIEAKNCNVFANYNNNTAIIEPGMSSSGQFTDTIIGLDWLATTIQTAVYALLYESPTKIPQTDAGMNLILTTIEGVCAQAVTNGLLAPGVWNSQGFGAISQGSVLKKGYYVYAPPVATQSQTQRAQRIAVPIQIAVKLAGAVHTVDASILVNQ